MLIAVLVGSCLGSIPLVRAQQAGYSILTSSPINTRSEQSTREIHCACVTANDRILVYRLLGNTLISPNLDQPSDFEGTLWLIDSGNTGKIQIAVLFHWMDGQLAADLYQDQDGDGKVAVDVTDGAPRVTEPGSWSIRATAVDGYWQRDGRITSNLDLLIDDQFIATFAGELYQQAMKNDGIVDVVVHVRGPQGDDPRSYDWRNVHTPFPSSSGIFRTTLMVREHGLEPSFTPSFPWYLLGPELGIVKPYGESFAPIQVDWETGRLAVLGEFVASRGSDVNWFTYSINRVEAGVETEPNFEDPFMFYDLANDNDSIPELQVRAERYITDDPFSPAPLAANGRPFQQIRYSWDQHNSQNWSYKLGLLGRNAIDTVVTFPDFSLKTIPYNEFPTWVTENTWDIASFFAAEQPLWTSEGIYDGDPSGPVRNIYYSGLDDSTGGFGSSVRVGLRGEYALHLEDQPWLYYSPIDHKLHLSKATAGLWVIDGQRQLRYLNDGGDEAFDGWQLFDGGRLVAQLYRISGGLLYSDDQGTFIIQAEISDQLFRTLPPTTHEEWQQLGEQLQANKREIPNGDLRAMFDQFGEDAIQISTSAIVDFARAENGSTIVLAADDLATQNALSSLTGAPTSPGLQIVSFADGRWSVAPAEMIAPSLTISVKPQNELRTVPVDVTITNSGSLSMSGATVTVRSVSPDGQTEVFVGSAQIDIAGSAEQTFPFSWSPGLGGPWKLQTTITRNTPDARTGEQVSILQYEKTVNVPLAEQVSPAVAGRLGWTGNLGGRVLMLLALLLLSGLASGIVLWRGLRLA